MFQFGYGICFFVLHGLQKLQELQKTTSNYNILGICISISY